MKQTIRTGRRPGSWLVVLLAGLISASSNACASGALEGSDGGGALPDGAGPSPDGGVVDLPPCPEDAFADLEGVAPSGTYFVSTSGDDANDGTSPDRAFATVQAGVDALEPGDTLTIAPGEYYGSAIREGIGGPGVDTTIRAEIPGTVILRGDIPAPDFEPLEGYDRVYVADFESTEEIQMINELDTLSGIQRVPGIPELTFSPGTFVQDRDAGKLYVSSSDGRPVVDHHYSLSMVPTHGLYFRDAERLVIDGISVTGFNQARLIDNREQTLRSVWGIALVDSRDSVVRRTHAYLNARGIAINSRNGEDGGGGNIVEQSLARANISPFSSGDTGGITLIKPSGDLVRDSVSILNSHYGINIRGGAEHGQDMENQSFLRRSIAWGNGTHDTRIKTGESHVHGIEELIGLGSSADSNLHPTHSILGEGRSSYGSDTIVFEHEGDLDTRREFVDPDNFDFRLQSTSRFVGGADDGTDRGRFPFEADVFFVATDGDDGADGLSVESAWNTLSHALEQLSGGDTLYVLGGTYSEDVTVTLSADEGAPIAIRGRGTDVVRIDGSVQITGSRHVAFERLHFSGDVHAADSEHIHFANTQFMGAATGLTASHVDDLRITHCMFTGFTTAGLAVSDSERLHLAANLYDNARGVAVSLDRAASVLYSNYNSFHSPVRAWQIGAGVCSLDDIREHFEVQSRSIVPEVTERGGVAALANAKPFSAGALYQRPFGPYREAIPEQRIELFYGPEIHSVSATTANLEWQTNLPAEATFSWGSTTDLEHTVTFEAHGFASYSFTGLEPSTTYYMRLESLRIPRLVDIVADPVEVDGEMISFTTLAEDPDPVTYYVSPDGSNSNGGLAWDDAFASIQRGADAVGVGDTLMIGEGTYHERVRARATGTEEAPILFRAAPGERVLMDGMEKNLNQALVVTKKQHLHFDGLQFRAYNFSPGSTTSWRQWMGAEFSLSDSEHITITRCLSDGRGGTSTARTVVATHVDGLVMRNCVSTNKMSNALFLADSRNILVEHSVFMRPMIRAFLLRSSHGARFQHNIFTDSIRKKAESNIELFGRDGGTSGLEMPDNVFLLRAFPPDERTVFGSQTALESDAITSPRFVDPLFAGAVALMDEGATSSFWPDRLVGSGVEYDFDVFMATHPDVVGAGIGLERSQFEDGQPR